MWVNSTGSHSVLFLAGAEGVNFAWFTTLGTTATIDNVSFKPYTPTTSELWAVEGIAAQSRFAKTTTESALVTTLYDQAASNEQVFPDTGLADTGNYNNTGNSSVSTAGAFTITATEFGEFNTNPFSDFAEVGKTYKVEFDYYTDNTANDFRCRGLGNTITGNNLPPSTTPTTESFVWTCTGSANFVAVQTSGSYNGTTITVTGIRVIDSGNPATQATSTAQPKLITAGVTELENGKPAMVFDGSDDYLQSNTFAESSQPITKIVVAKQSASGYLIDGSSLNRGVVGTTTTDLKRRIFAGTIDDYVVETSGNQELLYALFDDASSQLFVNGSGLGTKSIGTGGLDRVTIGTIHDQSTAFANAEIQEIIIYASDQSANRTILETNINDHYGIY